MRRHPDSWPAVDTCLLCWLYQPLHNRPIRRSHAIYVERGPRHIDRPMALCERCAHEHAALGERLGYTVHWVAPIPAPLTRADVAAAIARVHSAEPLPSEPSGADLRHPRPRQDDGNTLPGWMDDGDDLPGDEWKRGGK